MLLTLNCHTQVVSVRISAIQEIHTYKLGIEYPLLECDLFCVVLLKAKERRWHVADLYIPSAKQPIPSDLVIHVKIAQYQTGNDDRDFYF